jgi:hypothetical protein
MGQVRSVLLSESNGANEVVTQLVGDRSDLAAELRFGFHTPQHVSLAHSIQAFADSEFWGMLESLAEQVGGEDSLQTWAGYAIGATGTAVSVGYLIWSIRSGYLFASMLASTPIWTRIDPLPVVDFAVADALAKRRDRSRSKFSLIESLTRELATQPTV